MIQATAHIASMQVMNVPLYDEMIINGSETTMSPLVSITSQLTGNTKNFLSFFGYSFANKERYVRITFFFKSSAESPTSGQVIVGNTDFPYGMYDVKIYQNDPSTATNIDPDNAIKLLYTGLMNLTPETGNEAIDYKEYTTNDSETESVYITF
tara:strand:+ start:659 stop:1117 length:459 start_codon:yes stop_codon:yes gene_type:complete